MLQCLVLLALLIPVMPAHGDLAEAGMITISAPTVGWVVRFPAQGYKLGVLQDGQDDKGNYYMFTNATTGLTVSFYIEPAETCATADACRESYWKTQHSSMANDQGVRRFERNGFAGLEFLTEYRLPDPRSGKVEQHHVSGHLVRDGYWVDMHLSMMPYAAKDRRVFLDFVDSITVEPQRR